MSRKQLLIFALVIVVAIGSWLYADELRRKQIYKKIVPLGDLTTKEGLKLSQAQLDEISAAAKRAMEQYAAQQPGGTITPPLISSSLTQTNAWGIESPSAWTSKIDPNGEYIKLADGTVLPQSWFNFDQYFTTHSAYAPTGL